MLCVKFISVSHWPPSEAGMGWAFTVGSDDKTKSINRTFNQFKKGNVGEAKQRYFLII